MAPDIASAASGSSIGDLAPYGLVGGALMLLFRLVFRSLSVKDKEVWTLVRTYQAERDRANEWAQYHAQTSAYWQARALGVPNPPAYPKEPQSMPPPEINIDPVAPPS